MSKKNLLHLMTIMMVAMLSTVQLSCSSDNEDDGFPSLVDNDDVCTAMDDSKFMKWCYDNYDVNNDGKVSKTEAAAVREFTPNYYHPFNSIKGLDYFTGIEKLDIDGSFTEIDLSHMPNLKSLSIESKVTTFDLSKNPNITYIWIQNQNYYKESTLENPTNIIIGIEKLKNMSAYLFGIVKINEIDLTLNKVQLPETLIVKKLAIDNEVNERYKNRGEEEDVIISGETYHHYKNSGIYWQILNVK